MLYSLELLHLYEHNAIAYAKRSHACQLGDAVFPGLVLMSYMPDRVSSP